MRCGVEVFWPASYSGPVDFIAGRDHKRFQVKSAHWNRGKTLRVHTETHKYTRSSFDVLLAVTPDGSVWSARWPDVCHRKTLTVCKDMRKIA